MPEGAGVLAELVRAVQAGLRWLKASAVTVTEARDIAVTLTSLLAAERNRHSQLVQRLLSRLEEAQEPRGSWNDELWDTAWAIEALTTAGVPVSSPAMVRAVGFLEATRDEERSCWYEEPFETLLILSLVFRLPLPQLTGFGRKALDWLLDLQTPDGKLVGVRYTGMLVSTLRVAQDAGVGRFDEQIARGIAWLRADLAHRDRWTNAAWSNAYPLQAFADVGLTLADPLTAKAVQWFLSTQDPDGKWAQVARVHDTAMAVRVLTAFLRTPLVNLVPPRLGLLEAKQHDSAMFVSFQAPGIAAIKLGERFKIEDRVQTELATHQRRLLTASKRVRAGRRPTAPRGTREGLQEQLLEIGQYAYGHLFPPRIQRVIAESTADHLLLELDEPLIDLPWELLHDGKGYLCLRFAVGRRLVSDQAPGTRRRTTPAGGELRMLLISDPTENLPAARAEGAAIQALLGTMPFVSVDAVVGRNARKRDFLLALRRYDIVHFAGHALFDNENPDESSLAFWDGEIRAFEIERFATEGVPSLVFLNACWSAEEFTRPDAYPRLVRGLGRTFLFAGVNAYIGYLVPIPDASARALAQDFYTYLASGYTIGEALRMSRMATRERSPNDDITWASAVLYGDPSTLLFAQENK